MERIDTLVVGGGQAGLAMSEHLTARGVPHLVLERGRVAERWRSERWDSLVANGPAWHDRFPSREFDLPADAFAGRDDVVAYLEAVAGANGSPVRCGVEVRRVRPSGGGFRVETSQGPLEARRVVAATGPFQRPVVPTVVGDVPGVAQVHSSAYRSPDALPDGAVLVVGAGSSGAQIAEELARAGRRVFLSVGPHQRPPRRYRGRDFCWWLGALGHWEAPTPAPGAAHVTIAVSGAGGGRTVDFRRLAGGGITLLGMVEGCEGGALRVAPDLAANVRGGDESLLALLDEADAYVEAHGLDLPEEPEARRVGPDPPCMTDPVRSLDLAGAGVAAIVWATGYALDFGWIEADAFDAQGRPAHDRGVSRVPGLYFLGLPWLSMRGSSFIWGVWHDAARLAGHVAAERAAPARAEPV